MSIDTIILGFIGIGALLYIGRSVSNAMKGKSSCGCSPGCAGCKLCPSAQEDAKNTLNHKQKQ